MSRPEAALPDDFLDLSLFRERDRALRDFQRIHSRASREIVLALASLLAETPDPDQALNLVEQLITGSSDELIALLDRERVLLHYAVAVFGHSFWLGEALIHNPDIFYSLQRDKNLERSLSHEDFRENFARFRSRSVETEMSVLLARFKKREYVRIMLRDVLGIATLAETASEISAISDVILEEALHEAEARMRRRFGSPQYQDSHGRLTDARFAVLSLGKLGGSELNYSSDVDLLYIFGDHQSAVEISLREYFIRQAQTLTEILSRTTAEGAVFRIDLRLRPQGNEGELAVGLRHALNYYAQVAADWELQALIKVRHSAGDLSLAREFIRGVQRQVYTEDINFEAIETAINSREKIGARRRRLVAVRKTAEGPDVKLDRGGIRDIEFLVQCLQRVYGGGESWLRSGGTLFSLQKLHDKGHISGKEFHELTIAYEFLRKVEHRLQLQRGQQVHRVPLETAQLQVLDRAARREPREEGVNQFLFTLNSRMARVAQIYDRIIHSHRRREKARAENPVPDRPAAVRNKALDQLLDRVASESPALREAAAADELSLHARRNLERFLSSAATSPERYAALRESPAVLAKAKILFGASDYLTDLLVRHPDAIRVLEQLPGSSGRVLPEDPQDIFAHIQHDSELNEAMAGLRRSYRRWALAVGAQDVLSPRPVFVSLEESSRLADNAIRCALRIAGGEQALAVFALGRLGTTEFDIASDADLLFVRSPETDEAQARTVAEKLVHTLAAYTKEGMIFAVDARLRPRGAEGELVATPSQIERYLLHEAQPWEALTYSKLRFVAGREDLAEIALPLVRRHCIEIASRPGFVQAVVEMRARLEKSNRYPNSFKLARGGFYDIDFIASYIMLHHAVLHDGTTIDRLEHVSRRARLDPATCEKLRTAALLYRTTDHVIRLVTGRARPELPASEFPLHVTQALVDQILGRAKSGDLQSELRATEEDVRQIFLEILTA